jgi:hypothetical protein
MPISGKSGRYAASCPPGAVQPSLGWRCKCGDGLEAVTPGEVPDAPGLLWTGPLQPATFKHQANKKEPAKDTERGNSQGSRRERELAQSPGSHVQEEKKPANSDAAGWGGQGLAARLSNMGTLATGGESSARQEGVRVDRRGEKQNCQENGWHPGVCLGKAQTPVRRCFFSFS